MEEREEGLHPAWWTLGLVVLLGVALWLTYALFVGAFKSTETVTLTSDRSGLVMENDARVKLRGIQVGRVAAIQGGSEPVSLKLEIDKDKIKYIPANVEAQIRATTVFGGALLTGDYIAGNAVVTGGPDSQGRTLGLREGWEDEHPALHRSVA